MSVFLWNNTGCAVFMSPLESLESCRTTFFGYKRTLILLSSDVPLHALHAGFSGFVM